jgi:subtilisin family serine protease
MPSDPALPSRPRVRVAVVDSGIHPEHPHVGGVAGGIAIFKDGESADYLDRIGHGTAVAAAIREKAPDADLFAVKVFDRTLASSVGVLVRGIGWAARHECRVINLSLGTTRMEHEGPLRAAVDDTMARGLFLVAASDDGGQRWLPGCLEGVIGVRVDWDCPRDRFRVERQPAGGIVCYASGFPREIPGVPPSRNLMGISFAVANVSGFLARTLGNHPEATPATLAEVLAADAAALPFALSKSG